MVKKSHARFPLSRLRALALWRMWAHTWANGRDAECFEDRALRATEATDTFKCVTIWLEACVALWEGLEVALSELSSECERCR